VGAASCREIFHYFEFFLLSWFNIKKKSPSVVKQTLPRLRIYLLPKPKSDGRSSDFRIDLLPRTFPGLMRFAHQELFVSSYLLLDHKNYRRIIGPSGFISLSEANLQITNNQ
jgi:hypothetical protein